MASGEVLCIWHARTLLLIYSVWLVVHVVGWRGWLPARAFLFSYEASPFFILFLDTAFQSAFHISLFHARFSHTQNRERQRAPRGGAIARGGVRGPGRRPLLLLRRPGTRAPARGIAESPSSGRPDMWRWWSEQVEGREGGGSGRLEPSAEVIILLRIIGCQDVHAVQGFAYVQSLPA